MSVLILHRGPLAGAPYDEWLADHPGDLVLLAAAEQLALTGETLPGSGRYAHAEALAGYDLDGRVEARTLELARRHGVTTILASQERDLERAARLREILDLPGQRSASVEPFRDKGLMKRALRGAGIRVAPWTEVETAVDLVAFADQHGYPLVVKPRNGGGSVDLRILASPAELEGFLVGTPDFHGPAIPNLLAEAFVPGPMCHVDGLVADGRVVVAWPSQYLYSLSSFASDRGPRVDVTLDETDPLTARLLALTDEILAVLPGPRDFGFHAEVFHTPDDELVVCEIACRTGGAGIRDVQKALFGIDPTEYWLRAQLGLPLPGLDPTGRLRPRTMAGQLLLMKRPGQVVGVPPLPDLPWLERAKVFVEPGRRMPAPVNSADFMAAFVGTAPTRTECESRLRTLGAWFTSELNLTP